MNSHQLEELAAEQKAYREVPRLARELVEAGRLIAHQSGGLLGYLTEALREAGLYEEPAPVRRPGYVKKQIDGILRTKVFERDLYRCVKCATHLELTVDHIHPERLGGTLDFSNLQTLCRSCNASKGART